MYCQLKVYDWVFLVGFGCWGVLNTVIENNKGYKKTIKTDIFGNKIIEDNHGKKQIIKKDIFGNVIIENY